MNDENPEDNFQHLAIPEEEKKQEKSIITEKDEDEQSKSVASTDLYQ